MRGDHTLEDTDVPKANLLDLIPDDWTSRIANDSESLVWISCYRTWCIPFSELQDPFEIELDDAKIFLFWGTPRFPKFDQVVRSTQWGMPEIHLNIDGDEDHPSGPGAYAFIFIAAIDKNGKARPGHECVERVDTLASLLSVYSGRAAAWTKEFEYFLSPNLQYNMASPAIEQPAYWGKPAINDKVAAGIKKCDAILGHSTRDSERVALSARWYYRARIDRGVDGYLKLWIAIEALAMPTDTDTVSISQLLGEIYDLSSEAADTQFHVTLMARLRHQIVHNGASIPLDGHILRYASAIYDDLFFEIMGMPPQFRTQHELERQDVEVPIGEVLNDCLEKVEIPRREKKLQRLRLNSLTENDA